MTELKLYSMTLGTIDPEAGIHRVYHHLGVAANDSEAVLLAENTARSLHPGLFAEAVAQGGLKLESMITYTYKQLVQNFKARGQLEFEPLPDFWGSPALQVAPAPATPPVVAPLTVKEQNLTNRLLRYITNTKDKRLYYEVAKPFLTEYEQQLVEETLAV